MNAPALALETLLGLFYPPACGACGRSLPRGRWICGPCRATLRTIDAPFCSVCSQPFHGAISGEFSCANCAGQRFHFRCAVSRYRATGPARRLIHHFKYHGAIYLREPLVSLLEEGLRDPRIHGEPADAIVPVPLHPAKQRKRGFNQARELGSLLAKRHGFRFLDPLRRVRNTATQTHLDRQEHMENLRGAFLPRHNVDVRSLRLILVDDVFTTGSTADECARILLGAGAASVRVLTVARG